MSELSRSVQRRLKAQGVEWIDQLSHAHQRQFAVELYRAIAELTINYEPQKIIELLDSWQATAELDAAPEVAAIIHAAPETKEYVDWSPPGKR